MRIVFMGTPDFAARILDGIKDWHEVVAVYTQPDAVRGRGKKFVPSPVKTCALAAGIDVYEPSSLRDSDVIEHLRTLNPQMICVAAYGKILPQEVLDIPVWGCINVHASLLPRYRGAAPVERAILAGDTQTGVCIMRMEAGMDTGDYCFWSTCDIGDKSYEHLMGELADQGTRDLLSAIHAIEGGEVHWISQDESQATYAPKIKKGELNCSPHESSSVNLRRIQASGSTHPSRCIIAGRNVTLMRAKPVDACSRVSKLLADIQPGQVLLREKRLFLGCTDGPIELISLKPDGKKEMSAAAFASGVQEIKTDKVNWERL